MPLIVIVSLLLTLVISYLHSHNSMAQGQEGTASVYEAQLFDIYVKYHNQPTALEQWSELTNRINDIYEVRPGDSLWSISQILFGDGHFWPKIWSQNQSIANPHLLKVGSQITFFPGNESSAPNYTVTDNNTKETDSPDQQETSQSVEKIIAKKESPSGEETTTHGVRIPAPLTPLVPVLRNLPPSLPYSAISLNPDKNLGIDFVFVPKANLNHSIKIGYYITETESQGVGKVIAVEGAGDGGSRIAGAGQYVYVEIDLGQARVGEHFTTVKSLGKLRKLQNRLQKGEINAYNIEVQGRLKLIQQLSRELNIGNTKKKNVDIFKAKIYQSINVTMVGSTLIKEKIPIVTLNKNGPQSDINSEIIGGGYDNTRVMLGRGSIVFVNKGSEAGLRKGHVLTVRETPSGKEPSLPTQRKFSTYWTHSDCKS